VEILLGVGGKGARGKRSTGEANDGIGQGRFVLEDKADRLEELRLKSRRVESLTDQIVVFVFVSGNRNEHTEVILFSKYEVRQRASFRVSVVGGEKGTELQPKRL
jgi:hypothetical protein